MTASANGFDNSKRNGILALTVLLLLVAASRFIPHPPNFSPAIALALFCGFIFKQSRLAFVAPVALMVVTDLMIGLHPTMLFTYGSFALIALLGLKMKKATAFRVTGFAGLSSILFFLVTNAGVIFVTKFYPISFTGLMQSYTAGIPFFHNTLGSTLLFSAVLFAGHYIFVAKTEKAALPSMA